MVVGKKVEAWEEELVTRNVAGKLLQGGLSQMVLETLLGKFGWKGCKFKIPRKRRKTQGHFFDIFKAFFSGLAQPLPRTFF